MTINMGKNWWSKAKPMKAWFVFVSFAVFLSLFSQGIGYASVLSGEEGNLKRIIPEFNQSGMLLLFINEEANV